MLFKKQAVHDAWAAAKRTLDFKVVVKGKSYTATDISTLSYDSGAMNGEALTLGSTYTNTIKITFSHLIEDLALLDEITPQIGIQLPDGTWDFTSLGLFIIDAEVQQDRNNNTTTVSASDRMCMMGGTYESKLSYPAAINDIAVEIADMSGMKVNVDDFARLPTEKILSLGKVTYRDAIGYVAQFAGGFATFDRDGLLDIRVLSDPNFTVTPDQYQSKGLTKNEAFYRIGGLTCSVTTTVKDDSGSETQETTTLQSGSTAGTQIILNNPGMTQVLLDGLYEQLQDMNFYPFSLNWFGDPSLEAGDWITVQDTAGNEFRTPNLLYSLTFGGGVTATSKADTTITASANFVYRGATNQIITNIRRYLNAAGHAVSEGIDEPTSPKAGDIWFKKEGPDTTIMTYVIDQETGVGSWHEGPSTKVNAELQKLFEDLKEEMENTSAAASAAAIAGSAAMVAGNQASAAGSAAQSAANSVAAKVVESSKEVAAAKSAASSAVDQASQAVAASFDNTQQISTLKTDMADATTQASAAYVSANTALSTANTALDNAKTAIDSATTAATDASTALSTANTALTNANQAVTTTKTLSTKVDDITNTITTLATTETVNKLTGTVTTVKTLAQQNAAGLLTKADTKIVDTLNKTVSDHSAQLKLTATGAQFDAVSKVVDGVKNTVTTNTANIAANTQALMLAAKQTTVDALSKTVDNQTAQLKLTATEAELKTAQTSISTLDGRVTSINGQLNVQAGLIAAKVTASDVTGMLNGYATQSWSEGKISAAKNEITASVQNMTSDMATQKWTQGKLDLTADGLTSQISSVQTNLDNMQVGGRNYIKNSDKTVTINGDTDHFKILYYNLTPGIWTFSANAKYTRGNDTAIAVQVYNAGHATWISTTIPKIVNGRIETTFNVTSDAAKELLVYASHGSYFDTPGNTIEIDHYKLEQGNKSTDWSPAPEDMATVVQFTSLEQTLKGVQITANNAITQGQLSLLSDQLTSTITGVKNDLNNMQVGGRNYIKNSDQPITINGDTDHYKTMYTSLTNEYWTFSAEVKYTRGTDTSVFLAIYSADTAIGYNNASVPIVNGKIAWTFKPNNPAGVQLLMYASSGSWETTPGKTLEVSHRKLEKGNKSTDWSPAPEDQATVADVSSQFTQLQNDINLRVKTGDLVSQIDVNAKRILLDGASTYITNTTHIDTGVIKTAMIADAAIDSAKIANAAIDNAKIANASITAAKIADLAVGSAQIADGAISSAKIGNASITTAKIGDAQISSAKIISISADKITAGTLDAAKVNVVNLNASNITTGTISGANLSINLTTGQVVFQRGRIHSASDNVDINVDQGYMSVANGNARVMLKNGGIQFVQPNVFDVSTNPYLSISNGGSGLVYTGARIVGRDYVVLSNSANASNIFDQVIDGAETFAGISMGYDGLKWHPTKIGGADRGIILSAGQPLSSNVSVIGSPASITIGTKGQGAWGGNRIELTGEYVHSLSTYTKTSSGSANVIVSQDGALVRSTSAAKYKTDIQRTMDDDYGQKLLDLPTATWLDKADMKRYSDDPINQPVPTRNFGMIAEDLAAAGLEYLVVRGADGQLEGIEYDRIGPALIPVIAKLQKRIEILEQLKGEI